MSFTDIFGGNAIYPADPSFLSLSLTGDVVLQWPLEQSMAGVTTLASEIEVTPNAGGHSIFMPDATLGSLGYTTTFYNAGANPFTVKTATGATLGSVGSGEAWTFWLRDNSTVAGAWRIFQMGAGTSSANAATLAGAGLEADGTQLNEEMITSIHNANYVIVDADRANIQSWTGGVGTLTLPNPVTVGAGWFVPIKNNGSGSVTLLPTSGTIDGSGSLILSTLESAFLVTDGTNFFTVGFGQNTSSVFDFISLDVSGSGDFTLTGSQLNRVSYQFTGVLAGARNIIVPTSVQQYWVENSTTGAFALTVKTAAGIGVSVGQGERAILYCNGTYVVLAQTAGSVTFANGSATGPSVTFTTDANTGLYLAAADTLGFTTNGVTRGNIGPTGCWAVPVPSTNVLPAFTIVGATGGISLSVETNFGNSASAPGLLVKSNNSGGNALLSLTANNGIPGTNDFSIFQNGNTLETVIINRANQPINFLSGLVNMLQINTPGTNGVIIGTANANSIGFRNITSTSVGGAGGAAALPATPLGYLTVTVNGGTAKIPYYAS